MVCIVHLVRHKVGRVITPQVRMYSRPRMSTKIGGPFRYPPSMREDEVLLSVILCHCGNELLAAVPITRLGIGFVDVIDVIVDLRSIGLPLLL